MDDAYRKTGRMFYDVETHVAYAREAKVGEPLYVTTQVLGADEKRLHVFHRLHRRRDDEVIATGEQLHLHVDSAAAKAAPVDEAVRTALDRIRDAHAALPRPRRRAGRIGMAKA